MPFAANGLNMSGTPCGPHGKQHSDSVSSGDAWSIRALMKAEGSVWRKLKELNEEIKKLEPKEEEQ